MAGIFGDFLNKFKFTDEKQDERAHSNQIAVNNDDGAIQVDADSISQFAINLDWTYSNQAELIETYREVANYSLVDFAIEDIVGEMVSFDEDQDPVKIDLGNIDDKELSESIKQKVYESWDKVSQLLDLKQTINRRAKQFYIDGRLAYQKVIDQKKPADGLLDVIELDTRFVTKYRGVKYDQENRVIDGIEEYFLYDESNGKRQNTKETERNQQFKEALQLNPKSITYVTSGLTDPKTGYAISWLHKAVKPANQLRMMENALVIYRITRAPERRIFYVDTANLPKSKAEQYLRSLKNNYRNRMSFDPDSGTFKDQRHLQTMQEDYWLPRNSSGRGTEVSTLPGGCLAMNTKVSLLDGRELSIANVRDEMDEGKTLWTYSADPETGKVVPGLISWAGVTQKSAEVMKLTLDNGEEIVCTPDHKFPVYGKGFVRADELSEQESMIPLYRKNENIGPHKKLGYEQFFDNESKEWKFTHRMVADTLRDCEVFEYVYKENTNSVFDVRHHIDCDRFNNDPSNLCFMGFWDLKTLHQDKGFDEESQKLGCDSQIDFRKKESVHNHRVVKIERLDDKIEVGTLTIDQEEKYHNYHTFALSCGIFTKNSNLSDIEDVLYFQKQLYKALNIPISRLESDSMMPLGRSAEISRDELKFSKFVSKIRKRFNMMFLDLLKTELVLGKVITGKEWDEIEQKIEFKYALDMYIEELKQSEMIRDRLDLAREYEPHIGKYVPHSYIRREILKQTEEDIKELDKEIQEEKNNDQFYPPEGEEGGGFGGRQF